MDTIDIVFTTDDEHAVLAAVATRSLISEFEKSLSCDRYQVAFHMISLGLSKENKERLAQCAVSKSASTSISFLEYQVRATSGKERFAEIITIMYHLPGLLKALDRVICMDVDVMLTDDVSKLWEIDLEGKWLGIVPCLFGKDDCSLTNYNQLFKVMFSKRCQPVNTGVLIMNLALMRRLNVTNRLVRWTEENRRRARIVNQEAIAIEFADEWKPIGHEWNFRLFAEPCWTCPPAAFAEYARIKPSLVHFQNSLRPHIFTARLPHFDAWVRHLESTPWRGRLPAKKLNYLYFVYCEYFSLLGSMNRFIRSLNLKALLLCLLPLPAALF